jgi:hypothetical protein
VRGAEDAQRGHMREEPQTQIDQATVNLGWRSQRHLAALRASHRGGRICGTLVAGGAVRSTLCLAKSVVYVTHSESGVN